MQRLRRWLTVWVLPFAAIVGSAVLLILYWDRFPDPLAVHWGISGEPDGTLPLWLYAVAMIGGILLSWLGLIIGSRGAPNAPLASSVYFIIGLLAAINFQIISFNLDTTTWEEARDLDVLAFTGVLIVALLAGGLGWLLGGGRWSVPEDELLDMPATTASAWSGTASNLWLALIAVVPIALALVVTPIWAGLMVVIGILIVIFAFVRVDANEHGVAIALGPIGRPRRRIAIDRLTGAGAFEVRPMAYGGWGWRIRPGRRAYIIRGGPAIRIERANGVAVIVTVDDAPQGAAVIESLARTTVWLRGSADRARSDLFSRCHLRSRGPSGPPRSGHSGKNGAPQIGRDPICFRVAICGAVARAARRAAAIAGKMEPLLSRRPVSYRWTLREPYFVLRATRTRG